MIIAEILIQIVLQIALIFPGAFVRWVFFRFQKPYKSYLPQTELNVFIGIWLLIALVLVANV